MGVKGKLGGSWTSSMVLRTCRYEFHETRRMFEHPEWWGVETISFVQLGYCSSESHKFGLIKDFVSTVAFLRFVREDIHASSKYALPKLIWAWTSSRICPINFSRAANCFGNVSSGGVFKISSPSTSTAESLVSVPHRMLILLDQVQVHLLVT